MKTLYSICFSKPDFCVHHFIINRFRGQTVNSGDKETLFRFFRVGDVSNIRCQVCFLAIGHIVQAGG